MPIVGVRPASLAGNLRAEAITNRLSTRSQDAPGPALRPGALVELPPTGGATTRPSLTAPLVVVETARPTEQEAARTVIRAYQAARDVALPAAAQAPEPEVARATTAPVRVPAAEETERPAPRDDADQRSPGPTIGGLLAAGVSILAKPFVALRTEAALSRQGPAGRENGRGAEHPFREGGWTEAATLFTIIAVVGLGIWLLF